MNRSSIWLSRRSRLQIPQVGEGHPRVDCDEALVGQVAIPQQSAAVHQDFFRKQLTAGNLDHELALQPKHDVQEVDGLRAQIPL